MRGLINEYGWIIRLFSAVCVLAAAIFVCSPAADGFYAFEDENTERTSPSDTAELMSDITVKEEPSGETAAGNTSAGEYAVPEDIIRLQNEFSEEYKDKETAGTVRDGDFVLSAATDVIGNVAVRNTTAALKPDFAALIEKGCELDADTDGPLVLIFHTHTTESYLMTDDGYFYKDYQTKSTDPGKNVIRVGDEICRVLDERGIKYIHDTAVYDGEYNGAYSRSRVSVEKYLAEYPSIKIVLDVHRDAIYYSETEHGKQSHEINGKKAAQIMIIAGAEDSGITGFPDWEYNLRFALELQKKAQEKYYGLMKPVYFCPRKYNMDTARCSVLLEIGTDANTLDEAVYSAHLLGGALADVIGDHK